MKTFLIALALVAQGRAADPIVAFELPAEATAADAHPVTGALAVSFPAKDRLTVYPKAGAGSLDGAKDVEVSKPGDVVFKSVGGKTYCCVLSVGKDAGLTVLDAETFAVVKKVDLGLAYPRSLAASKNPKDKYLFYCGGLGHDTRLCAVDLETFAALGVVASGAGSAAVSGDGAVAYRLGPWTPSGFSAALVVPPESGKGPPRLRPVFDEHTSVPGYLPDAKGRFVVVGRQVYAPRLDKVLGVLGRVDEGVRSPAQFVSRSRPLIAGVVGPDAARELRVWSSNSFYEIASAALPKRAAPAKFNQAPIVREDSTTESFMVVQGAELIVVPASVLKVPVEPDLSIRFDGPLEASFDRAIDLRVASAFGDAVLALKSGPVGMKLVDGKLVWTPTGADIGEHRVAVVASAGKVKSQADVTLRVGRPSVALPFRVSSVAVSPGGYWAVAVGREKPEGVDNCLALVDLVALKVVARRA